MEKEKIARINELAKKSKQALRQEYIAEIRAQFRSTLENTVVQDASGNRTPLADYNKQQKK